VALIPPCTGVLHTSTMDQQRAIIISRFDNLSHSGPPNVSKFFLAVRVAVVGKGGVGEGERGKGVGCVVANQSGEETHFVYCFFAPLPSTIPSSSSSITQQTPHHFPTTQRASFGHYFTDPHPPSVAEFPPFPMFYFANRPLHAQHNCASLSLIVGYQFHPRVYCLPT
jgi:hypothetical protein